MASPRFKAGQFVMVNAPRPPFVPGRVYRIVTALPATDGPQQYRVKSDSEVFERVAAEAILEAAGRT